MAEEASPHIVISPVLENYTEQRQSTLSFVANGVASPYGLAVISYIFFWFACLIPPDVYREYMGEPDLMFLDPMTIVFYTLCVASFIAGAWLFNSLFPVGVVHRRIATRISPAAFLMAPLVLGILSTILTLFLLLIYHPDIVLLLLSAQGQELKDIVAFDVATSVNYAPLALTVIVWWAYWRSSDLEWKNGKYKWAKPAIVFALLLLIVTSTLILSRDILVMPLCGLAISFLVRKHLYSSIRFRYVLRIGAATAVFFAVLFLAFAMLRGSDSVDQQLHELFGYTVASYNRLAAIVNGDLRFPLAGHGLYVSSFLTTNRTFNKIFPVSRYLESPNPLETWGADFGAVSRAGLDGHLVWPGTFGCIFSDVGWFCLPLLFLYGLVYGLAWKSIKQGKALGVILYPCLGFCILFWIGSNILLDSQRAVVFVAALLLAAYERVFVKAEVRALKN